MELMTVDDTENWYAVYQKLARVVGVEATKKMCAYIGPRSQLFQPDHSQNLSKTGGIIRGNLPVSCTAKAILAKRARLLRCEG